jgi:cytochrome oxidase Cu insertion factor (SCO1/SenC/PrrC family)
MRKWLWVCVAVALGGWWYAKQKKAGPALPILQTVHSFSLRDETDTPFTEKQIANKPCIVNFMFTQCQGPCPLLMQRVATLARDPALAKIQFISITMDTTHDRPEVLRTYMKDKQFEGLSWKFLTGEQDSVVVFATQTLKVAAGADPEMHSTRLILLDAKGQVRGYYDSQEAAAMDKLKQDALTLF